MKLDNLLELEEVKVKQLAHLVQLETVHLQLLSLGNANFSQKLANVVALIALQLNHFTILGVVDHSAVTGKLLKKETRRSGRVFMRSSASGDEQVVTYLFACFYNFLFIEIVGNALHGGQRLATVTLLNPNVD